MCFMKKKMDHKENIEIVNAYMPLIVFKKYALDIFVKNCYLKACLKHAGID